MNINKPYALNEIGKRQNQEDSIFPAKNRANNNTRFFLVCDGMGGHENGEVASQTVCESFAAFLKDINPDDFNKAAFGQALNFAYDELDKKDNSPAHGSKMGTTLTFLYLNNKGAFLAHIGDSRIYHVRGNKILYKTQDHSLVNDLLKAGIISPEEAENHPKKNVITRAMQPHLEKRNKVGVYETADIKTGDYFFLCSDGILESLSDDRLVFILGEQAADSEKIQAINEICKEHSNDNFSAYLVPVAEGVAVMNQKPVFVETAETVQFVEDFPDNETEVTDPPRVENDKEAPEKIGRRQKSKLPAILLIVLLLAIAGIGAYFFLKHKSIEQPDELSKPPAINKHTKPEPKKPDSNVPFIDNEAEKPVEPINTSADRKTGEDSPKIDTGIRRKAEKFLKIRGKESTKENIDSVSKKEIENKPRQDTISKNQ
ncbi:MAG: protein phosphatase 2C domain-containing protein [Prevotellaceae bacterium]|jgi:protein phosphatase|nr:protein phosphatase 2C domain-containing protein [Prevotellaceae bacterium]